MATELRDRAQVSHRVSVLGPVTVGNDADLQLRDRTVLGVLVVRLGAAVSTDEIADAMWGDAVPQSSRKVIQGCIARLRRVLGSAAIATVGSGYRLDIDASEIDAHVFAARIDAAREELALGRAERAATETRRALAMWRGRPFGEVDGWAPAEAEARRFESIRESAHDVLLESLLFAGHFDAAAAEAEVLIEESPYRELRWALWARALYASGRQAEALRVLRRLRETLRDDLGLDPQPEIAALEAAILDQDPSLELAAAVTAGHRSPWPGLLPYELVDSENFYGREDAIVSCVDRLESTGRLVVAGPSGCGKSSFVRAGFVAQLVNRGSSVAVMTPGTDPLSVLERIGDPRVLVVDQVEEAVTQGASRQDQREFFARLAARPETVVLVVRSDLLDELAAHDGFASLLEAGLFLLRPLDQVGLRDAIVGPAAGAALRLEPGLVDLLLSECDQEPGALPLLSHALAETWSRAEGNTLTVAGYQMSGGIRGAVARSAEQVYSSLEADRQAAMKRLLLRLVTVHDGVASRTRVDRATSDVDLAERMIAARLLTTTDDGGGLQLAHEQLVRHWPRFASWITEDIEGQQILQRLVSETRDWLDEGCPDGSLYRGVRLETALSWAAEHPDSLTDQERRYLETSRLAVDGESRRSRRTNARLRTALIAAGVMLVAAVLGMGVAAHQRSTAERARDTALRAEDRSDALRIGLLATSQHNPSRAFALAAESISLDDSDATRRQVLETFGNHASLMSSGVAPEGTTWPSGVEQTPVGTEVVSPVGSLIASPAPGRVVLLDAQSREAVGMISGVPGAPNALAFDPTGRFLAGGISEEGFDETGTTFVWNVEQRQVVQRFDAGDGQVWSNYFTPDGTSLYTYGADGLHRWDLDGTRSLARTQTGEPTAFRFDDTLLSRWDDSADAMVAEACRLAGRSLTQDEWRTYVGDRPYTPRC